MAADEDEASSSWQSYCSTEEEEEEDQNPSRALASPLTCKHKAARTTFNANRSSSPRCRPTDDPGRETQGELLARGQLSLSSESLALHHLGKSPSTTEPTVYLDNGISRSIFLFAPPTITIPPTSFNMDNVNISEVVERLGSDEDAIRKMAVFRLQSSIGDPSYAELFMAEGGLAKLKDLIMKTNGNTLAYSLASFSRLLEVDKGWEAVEEDLIRRVT